MFTRPTTSSTLTRLSLVLGLLLLLLAACTTDTLMPPSPVAPVPSATDDTPLFTSADLKTAIALEELSEVTIAGTNLDNETEAVELPYVEVDDSQLATQAVLPNVEGWLVVYRVNTAGTYQIRLYDQTDDSGMTVYSGTDAVQSVAVDGSGTLVVASILDDTTGNHDIHLFDLAMSTNFMVTSTTSKDEIDVSINQAGDKIAYGREHSSGKLRPYICDYDSVSQSCALTNYSNFQDQYQPSLSANGNYLALIEDRPNNRYRVRVLDLVSETYTDVQTRGDVLADPSVDDSGEQVMFVRERSSGSYSIRLKDLDASTIRSTINDPNLLEHAYITAPAGHFVYGLLSPSSNTRKARTRDLTTNDFATPQGGAWDYYQSFWMWSEAPAIPCTDPVTIPDANLKGLVREELDLPPGDISCADMESLTYLENYFGSSISNLEGLQYAVNLDYLDLYDSQQIIDLSPLEGLTKLTYLDLSDNSIANLSPLASLTNLIRLYLGSNPVADLSPLANLTHLEDLGLSDMQTSNLSPLSGLSSLKTLSVSSSPISSVGTLSGLSNLERLTLVDNQISDLSGLAGLNQLKTLYLYDNQLTSLSSMPSLNSLLDLHLGDNQITNLNGMPNLPNLTTLTLNNNQVSDLSGLTGASLIVVYLSNNQLTSLSSLPSLPNLTGFYADQNQLGNLTGIANLSGLTGVGFNGNQLSDLSPLASLSALRTANLNDNQISNISPLVSIAGLGQGIGIVGLKNNCLDLSTGSQVSQAIATIEARNPNWSTVNTGFASDQNGPQCN